jgi:alpha-L-fucosidase
MKLTPASLLLLAGIASSAIAQPVTAPEIMPQGRGAGRGESAVPPEAIAKITGGKEIPPGPYQPTWDSIRANYKTPEWFLDGKFGIYFHWGLYSVPARQSEWYVRYIYGGNAGIMRDHVAKYGPLDKFGYKDFIPMFKAEKFNPDEWVALFKKAGARYMMAMAEHHDGFSMWDSALNKYNAKAMGPKRDLVGELAVAARRQGLKFGASNHSFEHFSFIRPPGPEVKTDLYDPEWADFYSVADRSQAAHLKFLDLWVAKNFELIDKYQLDMLWFDNGQNGRVWDPLKLRVAAYLYNRAAQWGKQVSISTKSDAYLAGSIRDYERQGRILPRELKPFPWQVDDPIGSKFGYVEEIQYKDAALLVRRLIDCVSMNGNYLLNISPKADGTIPQEQQDRLLAMGRWLEVNGDAIYGTRPWTRYGEGPYHDAPAAAARGADDPPSEAYSGKEIRFSTKGETLYAIVTDWPGEQAVITSLATGASSLPAGKIEKVELLGHSGALAFTQDAEGLKVKFPAQKPCDFAYALKITGLKLHP